jgi:hypothetical protein
MDTEQTPDSDLHLAVDGQRIAPVMIDRLAIFDITLPAQNIVLRSRAARPSAIGLGADERLLGYAIVQIALQTKPGQTETGQSEPRQIGLPTTDPGFDDGFHEVEETGVRWTSGAGRLPAALFRGVTGPAILLVRGFPLPAYPARDLAAEADAALLGRFESLGDNCEFGLVQRHFQVEPISLMRWVSTDHPRLLAGLRCRFAGLGDPAAAELQWREEPPEYKLRDRRFMSSHTWVQTRLTDPADEKRLLVAGCARLRLLRRKLLDDIEQPRRIFVFKSSAGLPDTADARDLHAALRAIGPASLLVVRHAATPADIGRVDQPAEGLFIGHIDTFDNARPSFAIWRTICAETARRADA